MCGQVFENESAGKLHRNTHSFESTFVSTKWEEQACKNCDFQCKPIYTIEVHIGKCYPTIILSIFSDFNTISVFIKSHTHLRHNSDKSLLFSGVP